MESTGNKLPDQAQVTPEDAKKARRNDLLTDKEIKRNRKGER